jgi:hypothetical protein
MFSIYVINGRTARLPPRPLKKDTPIRRLFDPLCVAFLAQAANDVKTALQNSRQKNRLKVLISEF